MAYYKYPKQKWSIAECEKKAKHLAKDGLGTPYPFRGYLGSGASVPPAFGKIRYNGGCVHNGEWYEGEIRPMPTLPKGFKIVSVSCWGWRLIKT